MKELKPIHYLYLAICLALIAYFGWAMINSDFREPREVLIEERIEK